LQTYLHEINTATGATLKPTQALGTVLEQIAAAGIPANEAALTASAWLAAKGSKVQSVNGFLASVVLPSMATGVGLDAEPAANKRTETPPSFAEVVSAEPRIEASPDVIEQALAECRKAVASSSRKGGMA
jgi:hypothetical protein